MPQNSEALHDFVPAVFESETRLLIGQRVPIGVGLFGLLMAAGAAFDGSYFAGRATALILTNGAYLVVLLLHLIGVRRSPARSFAYTVISSNALPLCMSIYFAVVQANAELLVIVDAIYLSGLLILYPWGWRGQLLGGLGILFGYPLALAGGSVPALPPIYGIAALTIAFGLTVFGAYLLESHRRDAYWHAAQLERANRLLEETNLELRAANEAKDRVLANASHDLRTPLNVIIGYGQLALDGGFGDLRPDLRDVFERIVTSGLGQLSLVEDLLTLSRLNLERMSLNVTEVSVGPLLEDIGAVATGLIRHQAIDVRVRPVDPALRVQADASRLRQILVNLISNAVKFTPAGTIELSATRENGIACIAVHDTGIGIPPEHREKIFEPFFQVDGVTPSTGAGLGLAIAQRLAGLMDAHLTVESTFGTGSTFLLSLPASSVPHPEPADLPFGRALS